MEAPVKFFCGNSILNRQVFAKTAPYYASSLISLHRRNDAVTRPRPRPQCALSLIASSFSANPINPNPNPQISFFINFFIKNGSHGTIHTFKNYFATVFSVFSKNKLYPNGPIVVLSKINKEPNLSILR